MLNRRRFVRQATGIVLLAIGGRRLSAGSPKPITVYKSRTCGCCTKWLDHLHAHGLSTVVHDEDNMDEIKDQLGVPPKLRSCHTALVGAYLLEGHVPVSDIQRLLRERPKVAGLAVPGMPPGTPGMAQSEAEEGNYEVIAFQLDGSSRTFARH
jgi:hypothetical protein